MIMVKLLSLAVALFITAVVSARNIKRDFQPPSRSHFELFLAGAPIGFIGMLIILPDHAEAIWLAVASRLISGIGYSFSLPRQLRYDKRSIEREDAPSKQK